MLDEKEEKASQQNKNLVSKCPENLAQLIQMANEFPLDAKTLDEICGGDYEKQWRKATNWIFEYLSDSPNCLAYVKGQSVISEVSDAILPDTQRLYENLRKSIEKLRLLATTLILPPPYILEKFNGTVFCNLDKSGNLNFSGEDMFMRIMQNIPPVRVRCCEICGKVFWAKKIGEKSVSKTCSKQHATNLRKRKSYEKNKENRIKNREEINEKRRQLRRQEKERRLKIEESKKREKKNGNL